MTRARAASPIGDWSQTVSAARAVIDLATAAWRTQLVHACASLELPDHVASGLDTNTELAAATGATPDRIERLMAALCAIEVFTTDDASYQLTPAGELLQRGHPASLRDLCLLYGREFYAAWAHAPEAISEAACGFERAHGTGLYEYLRDDDAAHRFQAALHASNRLVCEALPRALDFSATTVVDVGGGNGALLRAVLEATTDTTGILLDRPEMTAMAEVTLAVSPSSARSQVQSGDMFQHIPPDGDVYLLSRILGDWSEPECATILANCRAAMRPTGPAARLVVIERVTDHTRPTVLPELWDLHLMILNGGRQRRRADLVRLLATAGFEVDKSLDLPLETTGLVLRPA